MVKVFSGQNRSGMVDALCLSTLRVSKSEGLYLFGYGLFGSGMARNPQVGLR